LKLCFPLHHINVVAMVFMLHKTHSGEVLLNYSYGMQVFAHPEAQIGFHPDAGASFYLSRLPGYLGNTRLSLLLNMHYLSYVLFDIILSFSCEPEFFPFFLGTVLVFSILCFRGILGSNGRQA